MNRMSVSNSSVSTLPSGFLAVPVPRTSATPTKPLKSVIDDGSTPGPKGTKWNATLLTVVVAGVGRGSGMECAAAEAAAGGQEGAAEEGGEVRADPGARKVRGSGSGLEQQEPQRS